MSAAFRIAGKDLKLRIRDRSAIIIGIVAPLILAFIFSLIFAGALEGTSLNLRFGLVDDDRGEMSEAFVDLLEQLEADEFVNSLHRYADVGSAETAIEEGTINVFFVIPTGFSDQVSGGGAAQIDVVGDIDAPVSSQVGMAIADQFATGVEAARIAVITTASIEGTFPSPEFVAGLQSDPATAALTHQLNDASAETRQLDPITYFSAGMAIFFMFFTVQFGVGGLLEEERLGTMRRLNAAPISQWAVIRGKTILSMALGVISMTVLAVTSTFLMDANWGPVLGVALMIVAGVTAAVGLMGVIAAFARTPEGAENVGAILAVTLGLLGGVFFPLGQGNDLLATLTYITPHAWFMRGLADISGGASWTAAFPAVGALLLFASVSTLIGWLFLRRRVLR